MEKKELLLLLTDQTEKAGRKEGKSLNPNLG